MLTLFVILASAWVGSIVVVSIYNVVQHRRAMRAFEVARRLRGEPEQFSVPMDWSRRYP